MIVNPGSSRLHASTIWIDDPGPLIDFLGPADAAFLRGREGFVALGEITRFDQFDIDFNQQKYLIETRLSGALTRVYSAIALEEPVAASGGTGGDGGGAGTP